MENENRNYYIILKSDTTFPCCDKGTRLKTSCLGPSQRTSRNDEEQ